MMTERPAIFGREVASHLEQRPVGHEHRHSLCITFEPILLRTGFRQTCPAEHNKNPSTKRLANDASTMGKHLSPSTAARSRLLACERVEEQALSAKYRPIVVKYLRHLKSFFGPS